MDSFYGGHQGASFVIKARFKSIAEMEQAFARGPAYKDVWFGEYCIIDTPNKNDPDNGKIFRRGAEYDKEITAINTKYERGDPIEIGQIVGPSSGIPFVDFVKLSDIKNNYAKPNRTLAPGTNPGPYEEDANLMTEQRLYPYFASSGDTVAYQQEDPQKNVAFYYDRYNTGGDKTPAELSLVPKRTEDNQGIYRLDVDDTSSQFVSGKNVDAIKWTWCNIRDCGNEDIGYPYNTTRVHIGFQVPYHYFETKAMQISPYKNNGQAYQPNVQESFAIHEYGIKDSKENAFHHIVNFQIPAGIPGMAYTHLAVVTFDNSHLPPLYRPENLTVHTADTTPYVTVSGNKYQPQQNQRALVACLRCYDTVNNPMPQYKLQQMVYPDSHPTHPDTAYFVLEQDSNYSASKNNYDVQNSRVRSIWVYLADWNEPQVGTMIRQDPNDALTVDEYLEALNQDGTLILYNSVSTNVKAIKRWWVHDYSDTSIADT